MNTAPKLFLLDAYALIFRAYYAFISRPIRNSKGMNTSAIYGFVNALDEVIRKEKPTHLAVAFDPPSPTFRHNMFPAYKANRDETPEDIIKSVPYIKQILSAYNIPILEFEGFEADDVIGTVAKLAHNEGFQVFMMTPDKDYAQLVDNGIFMYKPRKSGNESEIWGPDEVKENFEVEKPIQVIDILALWGDSADNIPGAPGVGEKGAKKLIAQYGSVENLLEHTYELKGKLKENLENFTDQIKLSKTLATIALDVPINFNSKDIELMEIDKSRLESIFSELEFRTLAKRILGSTSGSQSVSQGILFEKVPEDKGDENEIFESFRTDGVKYILVDTDEKLEKVVGEIIHTDKLCFDTETTGLDVLNEDILGLALSFKEKEAYYVPFTRDYDSSSNKLKKFTQIFENKSIIKIGHNIKYDIQILRRYNIFVEGPLFDTMVAHYLLHPEGKHKLDVVTEDVLNYKMIHIEELIGNKGKDQLNMSDVEIERVKDYACEDADLTFRLYNVLYPQLKEKDQIKLATEMEMPLIEVLTDMELAGFNIDTGNLEEYEKQLALEIKEAESKIYELAGEKFNIASPKQLGVILFEKLKISSNTKMTKTKQYSTSEETLQRLISEHEIVGLILDYRGLTKLQSTYVTALPKLINVKTGHIHTSFNQTIAATGRLSSINPNLQNIPIRDERGREIRKSFIPSSKEYLLLSADYSQIELRLMAAISGDEHMIHAFAQGEDIHRSTAAKVYKVDQEQVTREMRSNAKTANFGIIYGISAFGLSQRLNIPRAEAKELIDSYFENFPKVKEYMDKSIEEAKQKSYVTTLFGRRRYLPDIHSSNAVVRGVAERNAINSPIQGSAADVIKLAMINIHKRLKNNYKTKMILQVHDELVFDVFKPELTDIKELVKYEMENACKLVVPLEVEVGTGNNWLEAH